MSLKFLASNAHHIKSGLFYTPNTDYNDSPCLVEAWCKTDPNTGGYIFPAGFGGNHIMLWGVNADANGFQSISGNFKRDSNGNDYSSRDAAAPGWCHMASLYCPPLYLGNWQTEPRVYSYVNGVMSSYVDLVNPRENLDGGAGSATFGVGGTDHSGYSGLLEQVRIFEGKSPIRALQTFMPEHSFRGGLYTNNGENVPVSLFYDLRTEWGKTIPDLGAGFNGGTHTGVLSSGYTSSSQFGESDNYTENLPSFVNEEHFRPPNPTIQPPTIPSNAVLYDSFAQPDQLAVWGDTIGLTSLEKGGTWENAETLGILGQRVYSTTENGHALFPVADHGSADMDVRIHTGTNWNPAVPNMLVRYDSPNSYIRLSPIHTQLYAQEFTNGQVTSQVNFLMPANVSEVRVVADGTECQIILDGVLKGTMTGLTGTGTKAGFQVAGVQRVSKFETYNV